MHFGKTFYYIVKASSCRRYLSVDCLHFAIKLYLKRLHCADCFLLHFCLVALYDQQMREINNRGISGIKSKIMAEAAGMNGF